MLQQTQVATVLPYYERFVAAFPDVSALAAAPLDAVLRLWAGLGYYARARNLHACAVRVVADFGGRFPQSARALATLPGIGRSTAAAIAAFCWNERAAILDGNVKRVLARHFAIEGLPGSSALERRLWATAEAALPDDPADMPAYTQGLMDLGATLCVRAAPACARCPVATSCRALQQGRVAELPTPRPPRAPRERAAHWLVLVHDGRVLLERRTPSGLWGGLLAPPQYDSARALRAALRRVLGADGDAAETTVLPARRHVFTHFTLRYTPHVVRVARLAAQASEPDRLWLPLDESGSAALPTPVRALLDDLRAGHTAHC